MTHRVVAWCYTLLLTFAVMVGIRPMTAQASVIYHIVDHSTASLSDVFDGFVTLSDYITVGPTFTTIPVSDFTVTVNSVPGIGPFQSITFGISLNSLFCPGGTPCHSIFLDAGSGFDQYFFPFGAFSTDGTFNSTVNSPNGVFTATLTITSVEAVPVPGVGAGLLIAFGGLVVWARRRKAVAPRVA